MYISKYSFFVPERKQRFDEFLVNFKFQLGLNTSLEPNQPNFVDIGPMTFEQAYQASGDQSYRKASFSTLTSYFRLFRLSIDRSAPVNYIKMFYFLIPINLPI